MGIKGLKQFLKKQVPRAFLRAPLSSLKGKKIAVDISCIMYKYMSVCQGREIDQTNLACCPLDQEKIFANWLNMFLGQCSNFVEMGITPIYVFDGKPIPQKEDEIERRKDIMEDKMDSIHRELDSLALVAAPSSGMEELTPAKLKELLEKTDSNVASMMKQVIHLPMSEKLKLKGIFSEIGVPIIQSTYDAEKTCSILCLNGIVDAVYTTDSDAIVYGTPVMIYDIKKENVPGEGIIDVCYVIHIPTLLSELEITQDQLADIAILCGTDYNHNIRGIGPVKAFNGIKKWGTIEKFIAEQHVSVEDAGNLNYKSCRDIFLEKELRGSYEGEFPHLSFDLKKVGECDSVLGKYSLRGGRYKSAVLSSPPKKKVKITMVPPSS